jgi:uncharacterized peroxidase-related enzyme
MTYLRTIGEPEATGEVARLYDADRARLGYVANYTKAFSSRPEVFVAWQHLNGAIKSAMGLYRYELVTLAAARRLRSSYCALAHGRALADILDEQAVRELVDPDANRLTAVDAAIVTLADKVAAGAADITETDLADVRSLGLDDEEILDVVLAAAARCFFSTVLDATGAEPDVAYNSIFDDATRDALTVGRPIAGA